jgi:hypothetical protein
VILIAAAMMGVCCAVFHLESVMKVTGCQTFDAG